MNEERLKILEMVESGKVSVEDAIKLLDAVKGGKQRSAEIHFDNTDFDQKIKKFVSQVDGFAKEFGGKMEVKFKEMEPAIKKATKTVVEKTAHVIDEISKALNESLRNMENKEKTNQCCENNCEPENNEDNNDDPCCGDIPGEN